MDSDIVRLMPFKEAERWNWKAKNQQLIGNDIEDN